jgi:hypothetical protein
VKAIRRPGVQALAELATASDEVWLDAGQSVDLRERSSLLLVIDGEVEASHPGSTVAIRSGPFDMVLGAAAFVPEGKWEAHARSRSRLLSIPIEAWYDVMEEHFDLARSTMGYLAERREALLDILAERAAPEGVVLR